MKLNLQLVLLLVFDLVSCEAMALELQLRNVLFFVAAITYQVKGHGRLIEPPSRGSMWRYGFNTPHNYNDHELYCGGFSRQWQRNGGKCGICGDPWDLPSPRPHEAGGKYGQGIITRKYKAGSKIPIRVELTANHRGYFEFRLCPNNSPKHVGTQECLDKYVLRRADRDQEQTHDTRYYPGPGSKVFETKYALPEKLTCTQCILQWRYIAGNNWGTCPNGTGAVGCGPQEEFRACADIAITYSDGTADDEPFDNEIPTDYTDNSNILSDLASEEEMWWIIAIVIVCSLAGVIIMLIMLYLYYYQARDKIKTWLQESNFGKQSETPVPPPRTKKNITAESQDKV